MNKWAHFQALLESYRSASYRQGFAHGQIKLLLDAVLIDDIPIPEDLESILPDIGRNEPEPVCQGKIVPGAS